MAIVTPLSVSGRWITDAKGNRVKLAGVNWAGAHQDAMAWARQADADWCWWMLDGTMCKGTTPQTSQLQFAPGDRSGYGLFAQDWAGVSNRALLEAPQAIQHPTTGPGA